MAYLCSFRLVTRENDAATRLQTPCAFVDELPNAPDILLPLLLERCVYISSAGGQNADGKGRKVRNGAVEVG